MKRKRLSSGRFGKNQKKKSHKRKLCGEDRKSKKKKVNHSVEERERHNDRSKSGKFTKKNRKSKSTQIQPSQDLKMNDLESQIKQLDILKEENQAVEKLIQENEIRTINVHKQPKMRQVSLYLIKAGAPPLLHTRARKKFGCNSKEWTYEIQKAKRQIADYEGISFSEVGKKYDYKECNKMDDVKAVLSQWEKPKFKPGCGIRCKKEHNDYDTFCPNCTRMWHKKCLQKKYKTKRLIQKCCPKCKFHVYKPLRK